MAYGLSDLPQSSNVQAFWKFEEASGTLYDETTNHNDGSYNGVLYQQTGKVGYGLGFDGSNDKVDSENDTSLRFTGSFTVSAWVLRGTTGSSQAVVDRWDWRFHKKVWSLIIGYDKIYFKISDDGDNYVAEYTTGTYTSTTEWYHIVGVYDSSVPELKIYVDKVLQSSSTIYSGEVSIPTSLYNTDTDVWIGGSVGISDYFNGTIDEVIIWDTALTPSEVTEVYDLVFKGTGVLSSQFNVQFITTTASLGNQFQVVSYGEKQLGNQFNITQILSWDVGSLPSQLNVSPVSIFSKLGSQVFIYLKTSKGLESQFNINEINTKAQLPSQFNVNEIKAIKTLGSQVNVTPITQAKILGSQLDITIKPLIKGVIYTDSGNVVESPIDCTNAFNTKLIFYNSMDTGIEPVVQMESSGDTNPTIPPGGTWETTYNLNDTYVTPAFTLPSESAGVITVKSRNARDPNGNVMEINDSVDMFDLIINIPTELNIIINEGPYVSSTSVALSLTAEDADEMCFKNETGGWSSWETYATSKAWTLTGGVGEKKVYFKCRNSMGFETDGTLYATTNLDTGVVGSITIGCRSEEGGSAIPESSYQVDNTPYFYWNIPPSNNPIVGYSVALDSGPDNEVDVSQTEMVESGLVVTAQSPASMSLDVNSGYLYHADSRHSYAGGTVTIGIADPSLGRIDIVYYCYVDETVKVLEGTPSATPTVPDLEEGYNLAEVKVEAGVTSITSDKITDKRELEVNYSYKENLISDGQHQFKVKGRNAAGMWSSVAVFNLWINANVPDIVNINGWTDSSKTVVLPNGALQTMDDSPYLEWADPNSLSDDTFYYSTDGSEPHTGSTNTTSNNLSLPSQGEGITIIKVKPRTGAGVWGAARQFILSYSSTSITDDIVVVVGNQVLRESQKQVIVEEIKYSIYEASYCRFNCPIRFDTGSVNNGDDVTVSWNGETLFSGVIKAQSPTASGSDENIGYEAAGLKEKLTVTPFIKNESGNVKYENKTATEIANDILKESGIPGTLDFGSLELVEMKFSANSVAEALNQLLRKAGHYAYYDTPEGEIKSVDLKGGTGKDVYLGELNQSVLTHSEYNITACNLHFSVAGCFTYCTVEGSKPRRETTIKLLPYWNTRYQQFYAMLKLFEWFYGRATFIGYITEECREELPYVYRRWRIPSGCLPLQPLISGESGMWKDSAQWDGVHKRWVTRKFDVSGNVDEKTGIVSFSKAQLFKIQYTMIPPSCTIEPATIYMRVCTSAKKPLKIRIGPVGTAHDRGVTAEKYLIDESFEKENVPRKGETQARDDTQKMIDLANQTLEKVKDEKFGGTVTLKDIDTSFDLSDRINIRNASGGKWDSLLAHLVSITWRFQEKETSLELTNEQFPM